MSISKILTFKFESKHEVRLGAGFTAIPLMTLVALVIASLFGVNARLHEAVPIFGLLSLAGAIYLIVAKMDLREERRKNATKTSTPPR